MSVNQVDPGGVADGAATPPGSRPWSDGFPRKTRDPGLMVATPPGSRPWGDGYPRVGSKTRDPGLMAATPPGSRMLPPLRGQECCDPLRGRELGVTGFPRVGSKTRDPGANGCDPS